MTFAQFVGQGGQNSSGVIGALNSIVVPVIITLAFLVFIWGVIKYFFINGDNEEQRAEGRSFILWGLLGLVLIFAIWGVVRILLSTLGIAPGR